MGLNSSNTQIAQALGLNPNDTQRMAAPLREGLVIRSLEPVLAGEVECDEVYVVAGHKEHPEAVKKRAERLTPTPERRAGARHPEERKTHRSSG